MYWDNYGLYAVGSFDSIQKKDDVPKTFYFEIKKKNYSGPVINCLCGKDPVIQNWIDDNPNPAIKGSELRVNIINIDNNVNLLDFYSEEDDMFKIVYYVQYPRTSTSISKILFQGYLVQDDCSEIMTDIAHEIQLTFTDNLGTLKDIPFDFACKRSVSDDDDIRTFIANIWVVPATGTDKEYLIIDDLQGSPIVGNSVIISGTLYADGTYSIGRKENYGTTGYKLFLNEEIPPIPFGSPSATVRYLTTTQLTDVVYLSDCFRICLQATGLKLETIYGGNLTLVDVTDKKDILAATKLNANTFQQNTNEYDSCYDVLEKICNRFKITIFQSLGSWYAIRWQECRYYNNDLKGFLYTWNYEPAGTLSSGITEVLDYGDNTDIQYGINKMIERPLKYFQQKYEFQQPDNMIKNGNLDNVGAFVRRVGGLGPDYWNLYEFLDWQNGIYGNVRDRYIAIRYNENGVEQERLAYVSQRFGFETSNFPACIPIEVNKNDYFKISFSFRTSILIDGGNSTPLPILVGNDSFLFVDGTLGNNPYNYSIPNNENWGDWHDVEFIVKSMHDDNKIQIGLTSIADKEFFGALVDNSFGEKGTFYKDITIEYLPRVINNSNVKGQIHRSYQGGNIKNIGEEDIYLDGTEKNYAKGSLFRSGLHNYIKNRATEWKDGRTNTIYSLGEIVTKQELLYRKYLRNKLEGELYRIIDLDDNVLSLNKIIHLGLLPGYNFIFGKLEINYREDSAKFTLYELWQNSESDELMVPNELPPYIPPYLYIPKGIGKDLSVLYTLKYF